MFFGVPGSTRESRYGVCERGLIAWLPWLRARCGRLPTTSTSDDSRSVRTPGAALAPRWKSGRVGLLLHPCASRRSRSSLGFDSARSRPASVRCVASATAVLSARKGEARRRRDWAEVVGSKAEAQETGGLSQARGRDGGQHRITLKQSRRLLNAGRGTDRLG